MKEAAALENSVFVQYDKPFTWQMLASSGRIEAQIYMYTDNQPEEINY